jgi:hypothetical protein
MHVEMACPGCGRKLRVATEHAGKSARCPLCNTIYNVPASASNQESAVPTEMWQLKTPEGQIYGPVSREILDQWVSEGRVSAECSLLSEPEGVWKDAVAVYPILRPVVRPNPQPVFDNPVTGTSPSPYVSGGEPARVRIMNGHRGGLVLALGIMSWALGCPILGVMAWVMGSNDIRDMQRGNMDPRGLGLTQAGQIIGMIHALLGLVAIVIVAFVMLVYTVLR